MRSSNVQANGAKQLRTIRNTNGNTKTGKERKKKVAGQNHEKEYRRKFKPPPQLITREVDYDKMILIQIDKRTSIYIKKGDNVQQAKENYLARLRDSKSQMAQKKTTVQVSKFKPVK